MNVLGTLGTYVSSALDFNKATLSGALDIIALKHDDGSMTCTPFHVRFGKLKLFRSRDKVIKITCNGQATDLVMRLSEAGEAYFIHMKHAEDIHSHPSAAATNNEGYPTVATLSSSSSASYPGSTTVSYSHPTVHRSGTVSASTVSDIEPSLSSSSRSLSPPLHRSRLQYNRSKDYYDRSGSSSSSSLSRNNNLSLNSTSPLSSVMIDNNTNNSLINSTTSTTSSTKNNIAKLPQLQIDGTVTVNGQPIGRIENFTSGNSSSSTNNHSNNNNRSSTEQVAEVTERLLAAAIKMEAPHIELSSTPVAEVAATLAQAITTNNTNEPIHPSSSLPLSDSPSTPAITSRQVRKKKKPYLSHTLIHRAYLRPLSGSLSDGEIESRSEDKVFVSLKPPLRKYTHRLITVQQYIISTGNRHHRRTKLSSSRRHQQEEYPPSASVSLSRDGSYVPNSYPRQRKGSMDQPLLNAIPSTTTIVSSELAKSTALPASSSTSIRAHHRRKSKRSGNRDHLSPPITDQTTIDLRGMRPDEYAELRASPPQIEGLPPISPSSAMQATLNEEQEVPFSEALLFAADIESAKQHEGRHHAQNDSANTTDDYDVSNPSSPPLSSQSTRKKSKAKRSSGTTKQNIANQTELALATATGATMKALEGIVAALPTGSRSTSTTTSPPLSLSKNRNGPNKLDLPPLTTNFDKNGSGTSTTLPIDSGTPNKKYPAAERPSTISLARRQRRRGTSPGHKPGMFSSVFSFLRGETRYIPDLSDNDSDNVNVGDDRTNGTVEDMRNGTVYSSDVPTEQPRNESSQQMGNDTPNKDTTTNHRENQIEQFKHSSHKLHQRMASVSTRNMSTTSVPATGSVFVPVTQGISTSKESGETIPRKHNARARRHSGVVAPLTHLYMPEDGTNESSLLSTNKSPVHHSRKTLSTNFSSASQVIVPPWHDSKRFQRSGSTVDENNLSKDKNSLSKVTSGTLTPSSAFVTPTFPGTNDGSNATNITKITLNAKEDTAGPEKSRMRWLNNFFSNSSTNPETNGNSTVPPSLSLTPAVGDITNTNSVTTTDAVTPKGSSSGSLLRGALPRQNWFAHEAVVDGEEGNESPSVSFESGTLSPVKMVSIRSGSSSIDRSASPVRRSAHLPPTESTSVDDNEFFEEIKRKLFYSDSFFLHMGHIIADAVHANEHVFVNVLETVLLPHLSLEETYHLPLDGDESTIGNTSTAWYAPKRSDKAGFITQRSRYGTEFSSLLPRALVRAGTIHPNSLLHEQYSSMHRRRRLHRSASFDISSMTSMQKTICYDAFALWAIEMSGNDPSNTIGLNDSATTVSNLAVVRDTTNGNGTTDSSNKDPDRIPRRISKREKYLGWIPVIGPLVIPNNSSGTPNTTIVPASSSAVGSHNHNNNSSNILNDDDSSSTVSTMNNSLSLTDGEDDRTDGGNKENKRRNGTKSVSYETDASSIDGPTNKSKDFQFHHHHYPSRFVRSLVPSSDQLATLPLVEGANILTFEVEGSGVSVTSSLYLWSPHTKIVISDVDGTITKSDVLGHIFYFVGRDWTHAGVAQLYSNIKANGYNIVYLTSRAIGQTDATKGYLQNIKQMEITDTHNEVTVSTTMNNSGTNTTLITKHTTNTSSSTSVTSSSPIKGMVTTTTSSTVSSTSTTTTTTATTATDDATKSSTGSAVADQGAAVTTTSVALASSLTNTLTTVTTPNTLSSPSTVLSSSSSSTKPVYQLPPGPVITSPDRLFTAFAREVIMRRPQEFKIAALRDIQRLFPPGVNPFYAGFGNRDTDILAYRTVGVGDGKIFIINPEGEIRQMNTTYRKTYGGMNKLIQEMFPLCRSLSIDTPGTGSRNGLPISTPDAYNDVNYWRTPLATLTLSDEEEAKKNRSSLGGTKGVTKK